MRGNKKVDGFRYSALPSFHQPHVLGLMGAPWSMWRDDIARVEAAGGRTQRDPDGVLAVYPVNGQRLFEVYDHD